MVLVMMLVMVIMLMVVGMVALVVMMMMISMIERCNSGSLDCRKLPPDLPLIKLIDSNWTLFADPRLFCSRW